MLPLIIDVDVDRHRSGVPAQDHRRRGAQRAGHRHRPAPIDMARFPGGRRLRILPHHACFSAAGHDLYSVVDGGPQIVARWPRVNGW